MEPENGTEIDRARAMVIWCYSERGGVSGSVFEVFSGKRTKKEKRSPSRKVDGLSATRIYAKETGRQKYSKMPIASGRCGGDIKRAISALPPLHQCWIRYCYGDRKHDAVNTFRHQARIAYRAIRPDRGLKRRTVIIQSFMLRIQIENARTYTDFCLWRPTMPPQLDTAITGKEWTDTYKAYWQEIRNLMLDIDRQALMRLATGEVIFER